jgi:hypothetical protein
MGGFIMYALNDVVAQMHAERLEQAQSHRTAWRLRALERARRRADRAEQRMSRARHEASRLRRELEAEG